MFGLFSLPDCPRCGGKTERTNYAAGYPQLRCRQCIRENKQQQSLQRQIDELKEQLANSPNEEEE